MREFYSYDSRFEDVDDVVARIWLAMLRVAPSDSRQVGPAKCLSRETQTCGQIESLNT